MDPLEQRVRDSLGARAADVEPTPALYRGVQDRIARRRRRRVLGAWVPAGALALAAAVAIPALLNTGPQVPSIDDYAEERAVGPAAPTRVVTVDRDGEVALLDLTDGSTEQPYGSLPVQAVLPQIDVAPEDLADVPRLHTGVVEEGDVGPVLRLGSLPAAASGSVEAELDRSPQVAGRFAVSPDGAWTAALGGPMEDADGWSLQLRATAAIVGATGEVGIVVPAGSVIQDWSGSLEPGATSEITVVTPDGQLLAFPLAYDGDRFTWIDEEVRSPLDGRPVTAYASAHLASGAGYVLVDDGDLTVRSVDGTNATGAVDVTDLVGDQDLATVALDAWGDSAVLSSPDGSWLLATDGEGGFSGPVALPDGTVRAALVGRHQEVGPPDAPADGDPQHALLAYEDGSIAVVDLVDGSRDDVWDGPGEVRSLSAAPGSTAQRYQAAAVVAPPGEPALVVTLWRDDDEHGNGSGGVVPTSTLDLPGGTGEVPSVATSPDGRWLAYTGASQQVDAAPAVYVVPLTSGSADDGPPEPHLARAVEVHTVTVADPTDRIDELIEWTGPVGAEGDVSHLRVRGDRQGRLVLERTADGFVVQQRETDGGDLGDAIDVSTGFGPADDEVFTLEASEDQLPKVRRGTAGGATSVLGVPPDEVRLDARGRTALLVGGGTAVTFRFPTDGQVVMGNPIDGVVAGALLGGLPPTRDAPADVDGDPEEPLATLLPEPVVIADARSVVLRGTDGTVTPLLELPPEGESTVAEVAVRPGSSAEDLTVVVATSAEGFTDLRVVDVVGGVLQDPVVLEGPYASAGVDDAGVRVQGLAWTPDGQKLLWVDRADAGETTLRSVGWDDGPGTGEPATDNTSFGLPFAFMPSLVDVVDAGGGRVVARFASPDDDRGWFRWVLEVQGDGALAAPTAEPELVTSPLSQGGVTALAGADDESRPTWLLVFGSDGPRLVADPYGTPRELDVPADVAPGDGLPETWLHVLGDGVLVGGSGQAWIVDAGGEATTLGDAVDADPVR